MHQRLGAIEVIIADDHEVVRRGLRSLLEQEGEFRVVGEAANGLEAIEEARRHDPDLAVLDLRMPEAGGVEACQAIKSFAPQTGVLILTSFDEDADILAAIHAGASAYLLKESAASELVAAARMVHAGKSFLDPAVALRVFAQVSRAQKRRDTKTARLSPRELEVLELMAEGLKNREIGQRLWVTERTVKTHVTNILRKLNQPSRALAVLDAARSGLIEVPKVADR